MLPEVSARDVDVLAQDLPDRVAASNNAYVSLLVRAGANDYRGRVRFSTAGTTFLQAARAFNDAETFIGSERNANAPYGATTAIWVRMQAQGASPTTLRMRAWVDGSPEPSTWAYTATDSTAAVQGAGPVGIQARLSSSATSIPTVFSIDNYVVTIL